ncbi:MAG: choice-of-anchor R domain-containing protein, partial [Candidatus Hodarchaeota archaeon]
MQNLTYVGTNDLHTPTNESGTAFQFVPSESSFNITDVTADKGYVSIEELTTGISEFISTSYPAIAQNFTVSTRAKLFSIWVYFRVENTPAKPDLNVSVCQDNSGEPGTVIASKTIIDLPASSIRWIQVNFTSPPILSANTKYWIMMNHTDLGVENGRFRWGVRTGILYFSGVILYDGSSWGEVNPGSMPLIVQILRVNGSDQALTYATPAACNMTYNSYSITDFTNIMMNTTAGSEDQIFQTNVSVIFNVSWRARFQSQDAHQVISLDYSVTDDSPLVDWNVTFACSGVNSSYTLSDYNLTWTTVPTDWEAGDLYQGTTNVTTDLNPTINGRTWSILNSTSTTTNYSVLTYRFETTSPNYVTNVGVSSLTYNLTQSVTTTTSFHSNIEINTGQLNVSILFPNSTIKVVNASMSHDASPQDTVIPLFSTYPNGTYQFISLYWNGTEVGLNISSVVTVYTPTELIIQRLESDPIPLGTI